MWLILRLLASNDIFANHKECRAELVRMRSGDACLLSSALHDLVDTLVVEKKKSDNIAGLVSDERQ